MPDEIERLWHRSEQVVHLTRLLKLACAAQLHAVWALLEEVYQDNPGALERASREAEQLAAELAGMLHESRNVVAMYALALMEAGLADGVARDLPSMVQLIGGMGAVER